MPAVETSERWTQFLPEMISLDQAHRKTGILRHLPLINILAATFLTVLNSNMVRVAVPQMHDTFGISYSWLTWVQNGYSLVYALLMPITGRLGDMYGRKRVFLFGVLSFTVGSLLSTFTWSFFSLIAFRTVQAIGSACIFPNAVIMAVSLYSKEERGKILGLWGSVGSVGAVIGPSLGGFLIEFLDWRSVFWVNIPIGVLVFLAGAIQLKESLVSERKKFDFLGAALFGVTIFCLLLALNLGNDFGWLSKEIWLLVALGIVLGVLFVIHERRCREPMVRLDLFFSRAFTVAMVCGMIHMYGGQGVGFLMPLFLVAVQSYGPAAMGLMLLPSAIVRVFSSPLGGTLSDRYGSRLPVSIGMSVQLVTFYLLGHLTKTSPAWYIWIALMFNGIGNGMIQSPVLNSVIGSHDSKESGVISGLFNMTRFVGGMVGTAVSGILVGDSIPDAEGIPPGPVSGFYHAFMFTCFTFVVGLFASRMLSDPHGRSTMRPARSHAS